MPHCWQQQVIVSQPLTFVGKMVLQATVFGRLHQSWMRCYHPGRTLSCDQPSRQATLQGHNFGIRAKLLKHPSSCSTLYHAIWVQHVRTCPRPLKMPMVGWSPLVDLGLKPQSILSYSLKRMKPSCCAIQGIPFCRLSRYVMQLL